MREYWNAAKIAFKLKLGISNPYKVKEEFCVLGAQMKQIKTRFVQKQKVNRNTFLYRLQLPDRDKCLGLTIGQYVKIEVNGQFRSYNPVSKIDEPGFVDFLIRDLRQRNGKESFTQHLLSLKEKDLVHITGPYTQYKYHGYGKLEWQGKSLHKYKHIGIIAFQSGITGAYNLIDSLMPCYDNKTAISLLWVGEQLDDFIFLEQFSMLAEQYRLNFNVMFRRPAEGWIGPYGNITKAHIESFMPVVGEDTVLQLFGGPKDVDGLYETLQELGYKNVMYPILK